MSVIVVCVLVAVGWVAGVCTWAWLGWNKPKEGVYVSQRDGRPVSMWGGDADAIRDAARDARRLEAVAESGKGETEARVRHLDLIFEREGAEAAFRQAKLELMEMIEFDAVLRQQLRPMFEGKETA